MPATVNLDPALPAGHDRGLWTIPNLISIVRLACLPVFVYLLFGRTTGRPRPGCSPALGATDWVDGYIARHFDQVSELGKILDPVADRLLFFVGLGCDPRRRHHPGWRSGSRPGPRGRRRPRRRSSSASWAPGESTSPGSARPAPSANMFAVPLVPRQPQHALATPRQLGWLAWITVIPGLVLSATSRPASTSRSRRGARWRRRSIGSVCGAPRVGRFQAMKAVIMAGGEGTRLRPLTSNVPKPMLPLANRPMMEHIVDLLQQHGFDEIVVTVAFLANTIRTYFGDGSEFGVRMVYATEDTPLGTAGSVRNAMDELDERFLVISGDVLTDIDLGRDRRLPRRAQGRWPPSASSPVENPLEFGIVITHEDGSIERFLEKPTWGQVFSDTINTGIFVLEPEIFDYIPADRPVDFSSEVFPALLDDGQAPVRRGRRRATGRTSARSRPTCRAHKDVLDGKVAGRHPGLRAAATACGWGRAPRSHPDGHDRRARRSSATTAGSRPARGSASTPCSAPTCGCAADADLERVVVHDNAYLGEGVRLRGAVVGRAVRPARRGAGCDEGVVLGDECFVGEHAVIGRGRQGLPVQDGRGRAPSSTPRSCGSRGAPAACSAATASPGWPTSTSPPSWPPGWRWPTAPRSRRARPSSRPATRAGRPGCSSGR